MYLVNTARYDELIKAWISWAVSNNVSCEGLRDLPGASKYIRASALQKWAFDALTWGMGE